MLASHLLQSAFVLVDTLLLQNVLDRPGWDELLGTLRTPGVEPALVQHHPPTGASAWA